MGENEAMAHLNLTEADIDSTAQEHPLVVLYFWAPWCAPCKQFGPIFEEVAGRHSDVVFAKVNADDNPGAIERFGVKSIPTVVILKGGEPVYNEAGVMNDLSFDTLVRMVGA